MNTNTAKHTADFGNIAFLASTMDTGNWKQSLAEFMLTKPIVTLFLQRYLLPLKYFGKSL